MANWLRKFRPAPSADRHRETLRTADTGHLVQRAAGPNQAEALAALAELAHRTLDLDPFPVQVQGAAALLDGTVVEMATGEGKTLVGALAAARFALTGRRVHVMTVNSYLANRDDSWMGPLFDAVGLTHGAITEHQDAATRRDIYTRDIIFGAVTDLGFDVLRDHLATRPDARITTPAEVALVDEADSVLVDQALVPLILAGSAPGTAPTTQINALVAALEPRVHFTIDDDHRNVFLTDEGAHFIESKLGISSLYDAQHIGSTLVQVNVALHAHHLLTRDVHYIVRDGGVALIDNSKGRVADLQRWPDGLQAAVEAKEGLTITDGGRILDSLTIQALIGRYPTVCGMTGTATAAKEQFRQFYGLGVKVIAPNVAPIRFDEADRVFATGAQRLAACVEYVAQVAGQGRPVLVGTQSVAESEEFAAALEERGLESVVLNAKNDAQEAAIIADAGLPGRVTVSTQMAGRGTDIRLGGHDEAHRQAVVEAGGLAVVGFGRHRSARLDNQLRGRAGRQGDPGSTVFFVALDDDVVEVGGAGERVKTSPDGRGEVSDKRVQAFVDHCQRVTEGQLLQIHANTWKYNKLVNDQRGIIDTRREELLTTPKALEELQAKASRPLDVDEQVAVQAARDVMLYHLDERWADHLAYLNDVRESIHLRALARESPIDEFHRLSIAAFKTLAAGAFEDAVHTWQEVRIDREGAHLEGQGLIRPSSTWTYMVNDNPISGRGALGGMMSLFK